jgi:prephenate dehydratase
MSSFKQFSPKPYCAPTKSPGIAALQGQKASFSHGTLCAIFTEIVDSNVLFYDNFDDPFLAVSEGRARTAIIPIKNTIAGFVPEVPGLIRKHGLQIIGEYFTPITMCLLGIPGTKVKDINYVSSHPMALKQCTDFLSKEGAHIVRQVSEDTGGSAAKVAKDRRKEFAAIASSAAAKEYGLEIIREGIENIKNNVTRFVILQKDNRPETAREIDLPYQKKEGIDYITSLILKPKRHDVWALGNILAIFQKNKIAHSFPAEFLAANFRTEGMLIDIYGHVNNENVQVALDEIRIKKNGEGYASNISVMGSYPAHHTKRFGREFNLT